MGTRDKKINGIAYEDFVSIDKGKNGCYVLKKIDGDVLEIKLPENQAGGLRNHLRRAETETALQRKQPLRDQIDSLNASKYKTHLYDELETPDIVSNRYINYQTVVFVNPDFRGGWFEGPDLAKRLNSRYFELTYWHELTTACVASLESLLPTGVEPAQMDAVKVFNSNLVKYTDRTYALWRDSLKIRSSAKEKLALERSTGRTVRVGSSDLLFQRLEGT